MSLFFNPSSTVLTASSNTNNNLSQPNLNDQTNIFSVPLIPPNHSFGNPPPQQPTFGSMGGGAGLLGNPQPSGGLFSHQTQQQPQGGGGLFGNPQPSGGLFGGQVQQQPQGGGLFGNQVQQQPPSGGLFGNQVQQQSQGGGLFGNPQPSGGLFGGQVQQQPQGGGLFGNQVQQQPQSGGLFGGQTQQQAQQRDIFGNPIPQFGGSLNPSFSGSGMGGFNRGNYSVTNSIPADGTVGYIGTNSVDYYPKNRENISLPSITHRIQGYTLDEIRMKDYFNLKNDTLSPDQKATVKNIISLNQGQIFALDIHGRISGPVLNLQPSQITFSPGNTQPSTLLGGNIQVIQTPGSLFMNPQPSQTTPSPLVTNNLSSTQPNNIQSSSLPIQTPKPVLEQPEAKNSVMKPTKPTKPAAKKSQKTALELNSGSFSFELNKMLFVSGLVQMMEKHNMKVPENLLDGTEFVPQLLEFLEQHGVSLPTENVPQFQISSFAPLGTETENNDEEFDE